MDKGIEGGRRPTADSEPAKDVKCRLVNTQRKTRVVSVVLGRWQEREGGMEAAGVNLCQVGHSTSLAGTTIVPNRRQKVHKSPAQGNTADMEFAATCM